MYIHIYVYIYIYMCIHIYLYTYIYIYMYTFIYTYIYVPYTCVARHHLPDRSLARTFMYKRQACAHVITDTKHRDAHTSKVHFHCNSHCNTHRNARTATHTL